jgi:hypothetical protein
MPPSKDDCNGDAYCDGGEKGGLFFDEGLDYVPGIFCSLLVAFILSTQIIVAWTLQARMIPQ